MLKFALGILTVGALFGAAPAVARGQEIGNDLSRCASSAHGPAVLIDLRGFASATGNVRLQSYLATRSAWLTKGAWLHRVEVAAKPRNGVMRICMPVPEPGKYGIAVRHDRNGNGKTDISQDGGGFSNNPAISLFNLGKPGVEKAAFSAGPGVTRITINLKYL